MAKLNLTAPAFCSGCHGQYPERRHVDLEAAWDGPVINTDGLRQVIDDLVLCEVCVGEAAGLVGFLPPGSEDKLQELYAQLAASDQTVAELRGYIDSLEAAVAAKPTTTAAGRKPAARR